MDTLKIRLIITLLVLLPSIIVCQVTFTDVSDSAGPGLGDGTARGISWADFNNDRLPDLFVPTAGNVPNKLYMNVGNGTFVDVAVQVGLNDLANTITCSWADIDNDGDLDLLTTATAAATRLWRNNRETGTDTTFTSIETSAGITMTGAQMSVWADYNRDGFVDVYSPLSSSTSSDALYRSNGNNTFTNVADSAGVNHNSSSSLDQGVHWGDFNSDGYPELFVGNLQTGGPSYFHVNNGNGTFTEVGATLGFNLAGRGSQWVDYNNDGLWDFSFASYAGGTTPLPMKLFRNNGNGTFTEVSTSAGITDPVISWGVTWADVNNDGYEDCFVSVSGQSTNCLLYKNNGNGTFTNVTAASGLSGLVQLSAAWGDYNNDGFMDLYTAGSTSAGNHLFRNNGDSTKHWLKVNLLGTQSNRAGIGAQIRVVAGNLRMMREVNTGVGYRSQNMLTAHFGLDTNTVVDSVVVRWPSGIMTSITNVAGDQFLTVAETVSPPTPRIVVNRDSILLFNDPQTDTMLVMNIGNAMLNVDSIVVGPGATAVLVNPRSFFVSPSDTQNVIIMVIITNAAMVDTASLYIFSNDPLDPLIIIPIRGEGLNSTSASAITPIAFSLEQNYPNPFNPTTMIRFTIRDVRFTSLQVYNLLGQEVATLVHEELKPGRYETRWDAGSLPSGVYFYRLRAGTFIETKRLLLMK